MLDADLREMEGLLLEAGIEPRVIYCHPTDYAAVALAARPGLRVTAHDDCRPGVITLRHE